MPPMFCIKYIKTYLPMSCLTLKIYFCVNIIDLAILQKLSENTVLLQHINVHDISWLIHFTYIYVQVLNNVS